MQVAALHCRKQNARDAHNERKSWGNPYFSIMSDDKKKKEDEEKPQEMPPGIDEISKQLEQLFKSGFGGASVKVNPFQMDDDDETGEGDDDIDDEVDPFSGLFEFNLMPRDIKAHLDRFVIRQDEAKKALGIAVCDHYNHAKFLRRLEEEDPEAASEVEFLKQNVMIIGPTGVGKTYLVKHIADLIGVPFVKADATKFSETGYVGGDVDDLVRELVRKADGDVELAEYGIIYIDEIDKLASRGGNTMGRDVSGRGVQTTLLKLMEETEVPLRNPMDMQSQMMAMMEMQRGGKGGSQKQSINTRHILFIVSGAFSGLDKVVSQRLRQGQIGFGAEHVGAPKESEILGLAASQDLIEFGFEAEFVGRLPVRVVCDPLPADALFSIMKDSEGSLIRQYEREFEAYGMSIRFTDGGLRLIAERAAEEKTGARGLLTVGEQLLRDFKFSLPGGSVSEIEVDERCILETEAVLAEYVERNKEVGLGKLEEDVNVYSRTFAEKNGITLEFDESALKVLADIVDEETLTPQQVLRGRLKDFHYGLKLIQNNTGKERFVVTGEALRDADKFLSDRVVESYSK